MSVTGQDRIVHQDNIITFHWQRKSSVYPYDEYWSDQGVVLQKCWHKEKITLKVFETQSPSTEAWCNQAAPNTAFLWQYFTFQVQYIVWKLPLSRGKEKQFLKKGDGWQLDDFTTYHPMKAKALLNSSISSKTTFRDNFSNHGGTGSRPRVGLFSAGYVHYYASYMCLQPLGEQEFSFVYHLEQNRSSHIRSFMRSPSNIWRTGLFDCILCQRNRHWKDDDVLSGNTRRLVMPGGPG